MPHPRFPVAVHLLLLRGDDVLLVRRSDTGYEDGGLSVVAGHVEAGESITQAAIREASEEVGVAVSRDRLRVVGVMHRRSHDERVDFFLAYDLGTDDQEPQNREPQKCSELLWANRASLPADTIPYVRAGIESFRKNDVWFKEFGWEPADPELRPATLADADQVADVFLRSRKELVAFAPLAHSDEDVRGWVSRRLIPAARTTVAVVDSAIVGFVSVAPARECSWVTHLYLHPSWIGRGIGTRLLELALRKLPPPIRLYTFQENQRARTFYERRGFRAVSFSDGAGNEEKCPDVLYEW